MRKRLASILREAREREGLSQAELAEKALGTPKKQSWVAKWESGSSAPSAINLLKISAALNLSLADYTDVYTVHPQEKPA